MSLADAALGRECPMLRMRNWGANVSGRCGIGARISLADAALGRECLWRTRHWGINVSGALGIGARMSLAHWALGRECPLLRGLGKGTRSEMDCIKNPTPRRRDACPERP